MQRALVLALLLATPVLAGCLGAGDDQTPDDPADIPDAGQTQQLFERLMANDEAHDHANYVQHQDAFRMSLLDHLPLAEPGQQSGLHALALSGDLLLASSTLGDDPGFAVVNVSDPTNLRVVGEYRNPSAVGGDRSIAVSEEGRWAFLANEGDVQAQEAGVRVIDLRDPANPTEVAYAPLDGGAHTVESITIDGQVYLFALNYGVQTFRLVETPAGVQLVKVGHYTFAGPAMTDVPDYENPGDYSAWALRAVYAHDMRAVHDPQAGTLLFVAYAYQGLHVLDVSTPEAPQLVTTWVPPGEEAPWYTHTVEVETLGDQRLVVVGSEVFEDRHVDTPSPLWVLDMTDLANPEHLSTWVNPAEAGSDNLLFSAHFFRLENGIIHLSHYHGGVWTIDVSTPETQAEPKVLGAYLPSQDTGFEPGEECCLGFNLGGVPVTMDAVAKDGVTFAADLQTGLYALQTEGLE